MEDAPEYLDSEEKLLWASADGVMGNWRRARIHGTCDPSEVKALAEALTDMAHFGPLHGGGICGLPSWPAEHIEAIGNLAERGCDGEAVARELVRLRKIAPSLRVHSIT